MAVGGFVAFAPDYLHLVGGTPADPDAARNLFPTLKPDDVLALTRKAVVAAAAHPAGSGKAGMVGFCWGGGQVIAQSCRSRNWRRASAIMALHRTLRWCPA
jgi:carboxymethylenebutenolidase